MIQTGSTTQLGLYEFKDEVAKAVEKFENTGGIISTPTLTTLHAITPEFDYQLARVDDTGNEYRWNPALTATVKWEPTGRNFLSESKAYTDEEILSLNIDSFKDDAGIHARTHLELIKNNITDSERIESLLSFGGNVGFKSGDLLFEGKTYASLNSLSSLTFSRASEAYALNTNNVYQNFAANAAREILGKGIFLENAATQRLPQPTDFSNSAWAKTLVNVVAVNNAAPNEIGSAYNIVENTTQASGASSVDAQLTSQTANNYCFSAHVRRGANRYMLGLISIQGGSTYGVGIDFDASGGATIQAASGALAPVNFGIEKIKGDLYRIFAAITTSSTVNITYTLRGSNGLAYANRVYPTTNGNVAFQCSWAQVEIGLKPTSPILVGGATRAADVCKLAWSGANTDDEAIVAYSTNSKVSLKRNNLAISTEINLMTDFAAAVGSFISSIYLFPARDSAFFADYADVDSRASALAVQDKTLLYGLNALFARSGLGRLNLNYSAALSDVAITENGCVPYLRIDRTNQKFYWNGQFYKTEQALLAQSGGVNISGRITWSAQAISDLDLLGGVTFSSGTEGFTNVGGGSVAAVGGELEFTSTASNGVFSRSLRGFGGKALKLSAKYRKGTAAGARLGASTYNSTLIFVDSPNSSVNANLSLFFSPINGRQFWIGGGQNGGGLGTSYFDDFKLQEVWPCVNFPNGCYTAVIEAVAPASLPASGEQVLFQLDCVNTNNRAYISIDSTGAVKLTSRYYGITGGTDYAAKSIVNLGSVAAGASLKIAIAVSASQIKAAMNGSGSTADAVGAVGGAYLRIGSSSTSGEEWSGTISNISIYAGAETLQWLINKTSSPTVIPLYKKTNMNILTVGDSFSEFSSTGFSTMLADLGYNVYSVGVGGSTMAEQKTYALAEPDLLKNSLIIWWDGVPNGHTEGQIDIEKGLLQDVLAVAGHTNFIWCRNGQTTVSNTSRDDMKNFMNWIAQKYGSNHVYDPTDMYKKLAIQDPTNAGYAADQSALTNEFIPPSIKMDTTHLTTAARRAIVKDIQRYINDAFSY